MESLSTVGLPGGQIRSSRVAVLGCAGEEYSRGRRTGTKFSGVEESGNPPSRLSPTIYFVIQLGCVTYSHKGRHTVPPIYHSKASPPSNRQEQLPATGNEGEQRVPHIPYTRHTSAEGPLVCVWHAKDRGPGRELDRALYM
jgi:hypothetical protein